MKLDIDYDNEAYLKDLLNARTWIIDAIYNLELLLEKHTFQEVGTIELSDIVDTLLYEKNNITKLIKENIK